MACLTNNERRGAGDCRATYAASTCAASLPCSKAKENVTCIVTSIRFLGAVETEGRSGNAPTENFNVLHFFALLIELLRRFFFDLMQLPRELERWTLTLRV